MSLDRSKVQFFSGDTIDKIVAYSSKTDSSSPSIPIDITYTVGAGGPLTPVFLLKSIPNPYGKRCIPNLSWSLDGLNYYDQIDQPNATTQVSVVCGCSDTTIYFYIQNQSTSSQTVHIQFAIDTIS